MSSPCGPCQAHRIDCTPESLFFVSSCWVVGVGSRDRCITGLSPAWGFRVAACPCATLQRGVEGTGLKVKRSINNADSFLSILTYPAVIAIAYPYSYSLFQKGLVQTESSVLLPSSWTTASAQQGPALTSNSRKASCAPRSPCAAHSSRRQDPASHSRWDPA